MRIVEIAGFDVQCCGGTHVHSLGELGRFSIFKTENKGRINKRLYVRLEGKQRTEEIEAGIAELDAGQGVAHESVAERVATWGTEGEEKAPGSGGVG